MGDEEARPEQPEPGSDQPEPGTEQPGPGGEEQEPELTAEQREELRQRLEEQLRKVRVQEVLLESVASILNLSARRITKQDERDLGQARIGIDAVRAVLELLDPEPREQVRNALSELQMLYAREAGGAPEPTGEPGAGAPASEAPKGGGSRRGSGLWTPPGSA
jgi:hypothetical protein